MKTLLVSLLFALLPALPLAAAGLPAGMMLKICEDEAEWPPYAYFKRNNGQRQDALTGISVDLLERILKRAGMRYQIDMLPWRRCLALIRAGHYHLAMNASATPERAAQYWLSRPYYALNSHYYYSRRQHPGGLQVNKLADLKQYRVCGLLGYNYETYGFKSEEVDQLPSSFLQLIGKLHLGRCDLFLEKREVMAGFALIDPAMAAALNDARLGSAPVPEVASTPFHMLLTRARPWAPALLTLIDQGLAEAEQSGAMDEIVRRYLP